MINNQRRQMNRALKQIVVPYLRSHQFKGSFPHFRRKQETHIDLITFQFNRYGGSFVVECTICPPKGVTMSWGEHIPPNKVTAHDMSERYRLQHEQSSSPWFDYELFETTEQFEMLARSVKCLLPINEPTWIAQHFTE